jgi:signal transduction histidine kinase
MSKLPALEPGLLALFRLFAGLRLGILALTALARLIWLVRGSLPLPQLPFDDYLTVFNLAEAGLLVVYLNWSPVEARLGRWFLPFGILLATVGPLIGHYLALAQLSPDWLVEGRVLLGSWQLFPILFVPLILVGWQYDFRAVLAYAVMTSLFELGLKMVALGWASPFLLAPAGAILFRTVAYGIVGYMVVQLMATQRRQRHSLAQANTKLANYAATLEQLTISRERNRLARELHDTLAHTLSAMAVQLEAIKVSLADDPDRAGMMVDQALRTTRIGLAETRRSLQALRASPLEELGLAQSIRQLAESLTARAGAELIWSGSERLEAVSPAVEQCVYRVAQEALENIVRHAMARSVTVGLVQTNGTLDLRISDDGWGFAIETVDGGHHFGLRGMAERAALVGGQLTVNSQAGQGTTIELTVETSL